MGSDNSRLHWGRFLTLLGLLAGAAGLHAEDRLPAGWTAAAAREEIRPQFSFDRLAGRRGDGALVIAASDSIADQGWLKNAFPVTGGKFYRFSAQRRTQDVQTPRRSTIVRIVWQDDAGKSVRADVPPGHEGEAGPIPLAEPEHPLDQATDAEGWTEVAGVYRAPSKATQAIVELHLQWAPNGRVAWSAVSFEETSPPESRKVRLAAVHYRPKGKSVRTNCEEFAPLIADAAKQHADLIVLGETVTYVGLSKKPHEVAEPIPGPSSEYFGQLAAQHRAHIVVSLYERDGKAVYNAAVLLGPDGSFLGKYRKVCLPHSEVEGGVTPGDEYPVFNTKLGKIGMMVCYDGFFPEVARELTNRGAEIIAWPVWGCNPLLAQARACENHVYVVSSTYTDAKTNWMLSAVYDHAGKAIAKCDNWGSVAVAEVDLSQTYFWRNNLGDFHSMVQRHRPPVANSELALIQAAGDLKRESFDRDPGWEGRNNRVVPKQVLTVKQDFGYSATNIAGNASGEIGGRIQRSTTPAAYAVALSESKTLDDRLTASGSFAITASQPGAGLFLGFFNSQQPGGSGRPIGSLGLDFDFEGKGGRLAVRLITAKNQSCGTFITPYLPGKFRPTPIKNDGTRYQWTLDYDPQGAGGKGRFTFTLASDSHKTQDYGPLPEASQREAEARFPNTTTFTVDLTDGFKQQGTIFDRFGLQNMMKSGGAATIYCDDLAYNGQKQDFTSDPGWTSVGNRITFEDREVVGAHDFGYSAKTSHAGGAPGEVGGGLWRSGDFGYYADRVGPLDLERRLEARGKVRMLTAGPDSDMSIGWFSSSANDKEPADERNFVGIHVGGPTRVGHYFIPVVATAKGRMAKVEKGPVLTPGKLFDWSLIYDPAANGGNGEVRVTLGEESVTLPLKPGQKAQGAVLDRFGLFTSTIGGQMVKIYLDDLVYSH